MSRYSNPTVLVQDANGKPITGAKTYFYETGTVTLKDVYSDSALSTTQANPVISLAGGYLPDIYLDGLYKVVQNDENDVSLWPSLDPVGDAAGGQFDLWLSDNSYSINEIVLGSDGEYYISLVNANQGNEPSTSPVQWQLIPVKDMASRKQIIDDNGTEIVIFTGVASAVNEITITNAATGNPPTVSSSGDDTDIGILFENEQAEEIFKLTPAPTGVNYVEMTSSATGDPLLIAAAGDDADIDIDVSSKADGVVTIGGTACTDGSGTATGGGYGGRVLIATATASSQATVDFETGIDSTYKYYMIELITVVPAVTGDDIWWRVKRASDSTWISSGTQYEQVGSGTAINQVVLAKDVSNITADGGFSGRIYITNPGSSTVHKFAESKGIVEQDTTGYTANVLDGGKYISTGAIEGFRFMFSSGNIGFGLFRLYGVIV